MDYVGKQAYVKFERMANRSLIINSIKTAIESYENLKNENKTNSNNLIGVYLMLAVDPSNPFEDYLIPLIARHDIFLSVAHGAQFIFIWSLFKRFSVYRTYNTQYFGYVNAMNEINKSILNYKNNSFSLVGILLNSKKRLKLANQYLTSVEYEINSKLKLFLEINSADHPIISTTRNTFMTSFEGVYEIVENNSFYIK